MANVRSAACRRPAGTPWPDRRPDRSGVGGGGGTRPDHPRGGVAERWAGGWTTDQPTRVASGATCPAHELPHSSSPDPQTDKAGCIAMQPAAARKPVVAAAAHCDRALSGVLIDITSTGWSGRGGWPPTWRGRRRGGGVRSPTRPPRRRGRSSGCRPRFVLRPPDARRPGVLRSVQTHRLQLAALGPASVNGRVGQQRQILAEQLHRNAPASRLAPSATSTSHAFPSRMPTADVRCAAGRCQPHLPRLPKPPISMAHRLRRLPTAAEGRRPVSLPSVRHSTSRRRQWPGSASPTHPCRTSAA
jgi:hypothetical protein